MDAIRISSTEPNQKTVTLGFLSHPVVQVDIPDLTICFDCSAHVD